MDSGPVRRLTAALTVACLACTMAACGVESRPVPGSPQPKLILTDSASGVLYELSVANGALVLAEGGSGSAAQAAGLRDSVTGASYQVGVANGALTLQPGGSAPATQIALADPATAKTYDLAVADGALTLVPADEGEK